MDIDALLQHYFGTDDPDTITDLGFTLGSERLRVDFGTEKEPGRRFALWVLMEVLGFAPLPATSPALSPSNGPSSWITTPGRAGLVMTSNFLL